MAALPQIEVCACERGHFSNGERCPEHFCGQPSEREIDQWVMLEDDSPYPYYRWMRKMAARCFPPPDIDVEYHIEGDLVIVRRPVYCDIWHANSHLTGRTSRELTGYDTLAEIEVTHRGKVTRIK